MKPVKLESLQGLRALAACLVVTFHIRTIQIGFYGVDIFFIISGFVIAFAAEVDHRHFFAKRIFRVVPFYWAATLGVFVLAFIKPNLLNHTTTEIIPLIKSLFFIPFQKGLVQPVLPQGWTLNFEMLFYLVFALALIWQPRGAWILVSATISAIAALGYIVDFHSVPLKFWTDPIIIEFVLGLLLYQFWKRWPMFFSSIPLWISIGGIAACLIVLSALPVDFHRFAFAALAAGVVGLGLSTEGRVVLPRFFLRVGDASYSLYLLHIYVLVAFEKFLDEFVKNIYVEIALIPVAFALCIGVALCSYALVERPSNRWLRAQLRRWPFSQSDMEVASARSI